MNIMSPYDCPICGTKLKVNSPQVIGVHERGKVHQAALNGNDSNENKLNVTIETKQVVVPVQKVTKTIEPKQPKSETPAIQTTEPVINHVQDKKTKPDPKQEDEWDGEFF